jgi:phage FluMu protein Com
LKTRIGRNISDRVAEPMERDKDSRSRAGDADCGQGALRCDCGSLLARYVDGKVELKCRRCKRTVFLPIETGARLRSGHAP